MPTTSKLSIVLLALALCSTCLAYCLPVLCTAQPVLCTAQPADSLVAEDTIKPHKWWIPDEAKASLSIRSPYLEDVPFDYEVLIGAQSKVWQAECAKEREDGLDYLNIDLSLKTSEKRLFQLEVATREKPAHHINQQSLMLGCKWIGYGTVTERYIAEDIKDAFYFRLPLPGPDGNLTLTTDFNRIHIWEGRTEYTFETDSMFQPFILAVIHIDKPHSKFYQLKVGVKYIVKP